MQEDIERRTVALSVKTVKLTAKGLAKALQAFLRQLQKEQEKSLTPQGRQPVKKLMNHRTAINALPLDGETKLFDQVARKYNVDYSFHKTGPKKHLLFFKAGQADAITAAFADYAKLVTERAKDKRPPVRERLEKAAEFIRHRPQERERVREAVRDER